MDRTFVYVANSASCDISVYTLDTRSGQLTDVATVKAGGSIKSLAVSPNRRFLYAANNTQPYSVESYAIDRDTGELELLSAVPVPEALTYLATDAGGRFLLSASYGGSLLVVLPIGRDGFCQAEATALLQPGRNAHCLIADPSNRFAYAPNLGSDHINQYLFDAATGALLPNRPAIAAAKHVSGPRHLCFSPNNRFAYLLAELSGEVVCYALDAASGVLTEKQYIAMLPPEAKIRPGTYVPPTNAKIPGAEPKLWGADIHITPNGRFLYASERSTSTLACFAIDPPTGTLTRNAGIETEKQPRGFNICPRGKYLVASGEKSDHVAAYAIDPQSGALKPVCRRPAGANPLWVEIVEI